MNRKDAVVIFCMFFAFFTYAIFLGLRTAQGIFLFMSLEVSVIILNIFILRYLDRISIKEASKRELEAEDSIFLQGVAFSQSALWIVLNLITADLSILILKWLIPTLAILSYGVRAYAKLKDNNKWRYYSTITLFLILTSSLYAIIRIIFFPLCENLMLIENIDVTEALFIMPLAQIPVLFFLHFVNRIKIRYGL
jgi:hypothetical protein